MKYILFTLLLAGCATVQTPITYSGACPADNAKCQRNRDAETLYYIGQPEAAWGLMCPNIVDEYGQVCTIY